MKKIIQYIVFINVLMLSGRLLADVRVTMSEAVPSLPVIVSFVPTSEVGNTTAFFRGTGAYRDVGQSFRTPGRAALATGVTFKIWNFDPQVEGKKFVIKFYRIGAVNKAPDIGTDLLYEEQGVLPEVLEAGQYLTFRFTDSVELSPVGAYMVLFGFAEPTSGDGSANLLGFERSNDTDRSGRLWLYNGKTFAADNKAVTFYLHGK